MFFNLLQIVILFKEAQKSLPVFQNKKLTISKYKIVSFQLVKNRSIVNKNYLYRNGKTKERKRE